MKAEIEAEGEAPALVDRSELEAGKASLYTEIVQDEIASTTAAEACRR
jgi:hypothetical protein